MEGKPVDWYSDVFDVVFPDINKDHINGLWQDRLRKPAKGEEED
jgi:ATP-dependent Lon protease